MSLSCAGLLIGAVSSSSFGGADGRDVVAVHCGAGQQLLAVAFAVDRSFRLAEKTIDQFARRHDRLGCLELLCQLLVLRFEGGGLFLVDTRVGGPGFHLLEFALDVLPLTDVIGGQHPYRRHQHGDRGQAEDDVHQLLVTPCLFCSGHSKGAFDGRNVPRGQKFRKYSSIWIRYFRLQVHRKTIFNGSDTINSSRFASNM